MMALQGSVSVAIVVTAAIVTTAANGQDGDNWALDAATGCRIWNEAPPDAAGGVAWTGSCLDGMASGSGVLVWWDGNGQRGRYEGEMRAGKLDGEGRLRIRDDEAGGFHRFLGRFEDNQPVGSGFLTKADGTRFVGEMLDGIGHARGTLITPDGWIVKGEFIGEEAVGTVVADYTTEDGERYMGQAENNERHGFGILTDRQGNFYAGGFESGMPEGPGIFIGTGGDRFVGLFENGRPNGVGTSIDAEGVAVQGRFVDGDPEGSVLVTGEDGTQSLANVEEEDIR